jgi:DNA repair protein RadC
VYLRELQARYRVRHLAGSALPPGPLHTPRDAAHVFAALLCQEVIEVCGLLCLSTRRGVLAYHELSRGTVDTTVMHPRDVFTIALLCNASGVIVGHLHPSGDVTPSADDRAVTARIASAGQIVGVELVDHVIVAEGGKYWSFKEAGLL